MKTTSELTLPFAIILASFVAGCGTVTQTVYLNDLSVSGPIAQPPVHLTNKPAAGEFHVSPRVSVTGDRSFENRIDGNVYSPPVNQPAGNNLHWSIPSAQFGLDCDWMASGSVALNFGLTYASTSLVESWGGNAGIGFPIAGESVSSRFEAGIQFQTMWFDAHSVVVSQYQPLFSSTTDTSVGYFHDINRSTPYNVYATFTLNSHSDNLVNFFASASVSRQTLVRFQPRQVDILGPLADYHYTDARADQTVTIFMFTPGLAIRVNPSTQMLAGVRIMLPSGFGDNMPLLIAPMIQMDLKL